MLGFEINKSAPELAVAEIEAVTGKKGKLKGNFYIIDYPYDHKFARLAFTKRIMAGYFGSHMFYRALVCDVNKANHYEQRRSHLLPAQHPAMTHPRLARAMINLANANEILDPFCGAGGILIEAALCSISAVGFDIDPIMLKRAKKNLKYFKIKDVKLKLQDATTFKSSVKVVVTDLPYAKNTKVTAPIEELYAKFLRNLKKNNIERAVIGFPDTVNYKQIIRDAGFKIKNEFTYYLHRSLSKKIIVLSV
ncbi:MAG TPA: methyltransferase domain-containing protein [Candidatus Nanoarchaeia archaeon]|nr:methyltransferase domain-containing protein [Candidatus Nanoarchaeia archaeon]